MANQHNRPPGPKGSLIRGVLPQFLKNPLNFLAHNAAQYGDVVRVRFFNRYIYLLNHPDYVQHVLVNNNQNYLKGKALRVTEPIIGNGLLTSEGKYHQRQRRLIQPAFHRRQVASFAQTMTQLTERHLATWRDGETRDLHHELMRLTMSIVTQTLFGLDISYSNKAAAQALGCLMGEFSFLEATTPLGRFRAKFPPFRRRRETLLRTLDEMIYSFIQMGEERLNQSDNLLSMLLTIRDVESDDSGMTDKQLRDEIMTLFIAGHETTANALTWTFYLLAQHPTAAMRFETELADLLNGRTPTVGDMAGLKYTRMIFSEAMRLYPPAWAIGRLARADDEIGGYHIPAGSTVIVSQWVMHHHPVYWDEPYQFDPERFAPDNASSQKRPRYAYFPFGGGPRLCIGEPFAWMEGILLLATIAQRFRFSLSPETRVALSPRITLRPRAGLPVTVHQRPNHEP